MSRNNGYRPPKSAQAEQEEKLISSLRTFIRTQGAAYLHDPNVSSIGIGYRTKGEREGEVAIQFTVDEKAAPEELEALGTQALPESVTVDGVEVPTEVIERRYTTHYDVLAEAAAEPPDRQQRIDPLAPGASIGNIRIPVGTRGSAGTAGCIVFDRNGSPYVLSNWHVLNTPEGEIGDDCVQPGARDDNRVGGNRFGKLARSHLGISGDCAVASITDRRFDRAILGLNVVPRRLGRPSLRDKVVKCGRTTGVTHGLVKRIETTVKIDYGGTVGLQQIGCFEIGVDPAFAPPDGEVSLPGDSGAVWMFTDANGTPTDVIAGLHFSGETKDSPDEHALACLPDSVFTKLEITPEPPPPEALVAVDGYDPGFLRKRIEVPELHTKIEHDAVRIDGSEVIRHTHYSLAQSMSRRFAFWVAWNVDGGTLKKLNRKGKKFVLDPRVPPNFQVDNELYKDKNGRVDHLDRGHVARRADLTWGSAAEAEQANKESFFYTNITPQMDDFNQSARNGLWGRLEDAVYAEVDVDDLRISVFGGPVFQDDDRVFRQVRIPREYWKVIVFSEGEELRAKAFLLTQNVDQIEALDLDEFRVFQVTLTELEDRIHVHFDPEMHQADTSDLPELMVERQPLDSLAEITWH
ncbi:DNA/RNA non-specific endonuclease [Kitasatospora sp. NPDC047058]|uniref:DNA/RNA non-specific endonuclease n=1 Tax=Kitasatospora sp. NPDC047058 TaxID=3155620 RepID=UPI0033FFE472